MVSSPAAQRVRKLPDERRAEILAEAASIALSEGLERITLRAVADRLGVRPGLISHYYPAAEDLVIAAFVRAVSEEREELFPDDGTPLQRLAHLVSRSEGHKSLELTRLWLNARHLCRFTPALTEALLGQEQLDRNRLTTLIEDGVASGDFVVADPFAACIRIWVAIDGVGSYVNNAEPFDYDAFKRFITDVAEWSLGVPAGVLRAAVDRLQAA
ncbi:TetR family transcriptional regulator [Arthrobacter sp. MYb23]|uniref:TetR/AcrR family transcriptional regulator n=1 Tax=unclassified Arthrobacter TaxID=235627 RepID=UPI000CFD0ECF|nr:MULTISPECIES: TetR family transcriptional regulator [unclassified Arthrobacter]PRB37024.1 TetR family transcriptional regulator [Arthrobacter sp. MYb51]PRB90196.1 TetR family transcriptional regulator [Arthrobacter sp. MYb23]